MNECGNHSIRNGWNKGNEESVVFVQNDIVDRININLATDDDLLLRIGCHGGMKRENTRRMALMSIFIIVLDVSSN